MLTTTIRPTPKQPGGPLKVLIIGRISDPTQDKENIPASYRVDDQLLAQIYDGPTETRYFGEQASGLLPDRPTIVEVRDLIATGEWDLVISEDLARIFRNPCYQWAFVQDAVDHDTRVICIADNIDTADENWETMMHAATIRHGMAIPDTRRRVKRTATHTFDKGGMVLKVRYGYRKLSAEEAASGEFGPVGLRVARLTECTPILRGMRDRILRGDSYDTVAEWLNGEPVPPGPYVETGRWTGRLVEDLLRDPILSGTRTFRDILCQPVFKTGKHRRVRNAKGPEMKSYPELAHLGVEDHEELLRVMDARRGDRAYPSGRDNPRWNQPRSRSLWPGQHARCGICGGRMYCFGTMLRCQNAVPKGPRTCWNHVQADIATVRAKVLPWVLGRLDELPGVRHTLIESAWREFERVRRRHECSGGDITRRIDELEGMSKNLASAIAKIGDLEGLLGESVEVDTALREARAEKARLDAQAQAAGEFLSREDIAARLDEALMRMAETSFEFADLLRRLVPEFSIQPVQALDCPQVRPRAKLTLRPDAWASGVEPVPEVSVTMDLFDPPEPIKHLAACVAAKAATPKASYSVIGNRLGINRMTVKRALAYHRLMEVAGLSDPYREIHEQPEQASRWTKQRRRHAVASP